MSWIYGPYFIIFITLITLQLTSADFDNSAWYSCLGVCFAVCVCKSEFDFQSICWVRTWQGAQVVYCLYPHTYTHSYTLMKLTDADLVRGQTPGLSALVTQIHTHALRWGAHLLWACQRLPSFPVGVYVCCWWGRGGSRWEYWWIMLQVMRWVMMGTETQAASNLFICALLSYNFLNYLSHSWGDKTSHSGLGVKAETHECIHTLWSLRCSQISLT